MSNYTEMGQVINTLTKIQAPLIGAKNKKSIIMLTTLDNVIQLVKREMDLYEFENKEVQE